MKNTYLTVGSYVILPAIFILIFIDLAGAFLYNDVPFLLALILYGMFTVVHRSSSRLTLMLAVFILVWMGLSYVPTGAGTVTERIGEWFYIFCAAGLIQYLKEVYESKG